MAPISVLNPILSWIKHADVGRKKSGDWVQKIRYSTSSFKSGYLLKKEVPASTAKSVDVVSASTIYLLWIPVLE